MKGVDAKKVAVVVGGSGQIGQIVVKGFLDQDCDVAVVSRGRTDTSCIDKLRRRGLKLKQFRADVGTRIDLRRCLQSIQREFGRQDFMVYTPGFTPDTDVPLLCYSAAAWERTFRVYVTGLFFCFQVALPMLQRGGHFLVVSSAITRFTGENLPPLHAGHYAAAKAAVNEFCKWSRREAHEKHCLLSRLAPSAVDVAFHRNAPEHRRPPVMIPVETVAAKIVRAAISGTEIDEDLVNV